MNIKIDILKGNVILSDLDDFDHLPMQNYLKIINEGIEILAVKIFHENKADFIKTRLVAGRCNLEFKNELVLGDKWILNVRLIEVNSRYLILDFNLKSKKQIKAKARITLVPFNLINRKSITFGMQEISFVRDFFLKDE